MKCWTSLSINGKEKFFHVYNYFNFSFELKHDKFELSHYNKWSRCSIMNVHKKDVIQLLETIAMYMELKGENSFKISAFRKAANSLERDERGLLEIEDFTTLPNIGKGTASIIQEYIRTGNSEVLQSLKEEVPNGLIPLLKLPGLGGKKLARLYQELNITNVDELKEACQSGKIRHLAGFGEKTEKKILLELEKLGQRPERLPIAYMLLVAEWIESKLQKMEGIIQYSRAGSLRRYKETIKDLDFIISTNERDKVIEQLLSLEHIKEVLASGPTKISCVLGLDFDVSVDFRIVHEIEFATTLHHFTGSKDHNVRMRQIAKERGEKISEYGVEQIETGHVEHFRTEEEFFQHFNLPFIPPEMREDGSELDRLEELEKLVHLNYIKGDLHMHTTWSDGAHTIEEMIEEARRKGYEYIAITDHSQYLKVANGLTIDRLLKQKEEIARLNEKYRDIVIFSGVEMDILPDGSLDYPDNILKELDIVIAAIHSSFQQSEDMIMKRLQNACENPYVNIIAHPTGRIIGRREGYKVNVEKLLHMAKETNTILELNANPNRLDLSYQFLKDATEMGVKIAINTDAHHINQLHFMKIGTKLARKGWLKKMDCINTFHAKDLLQQLNNKKTNR